MVKGRKGAETERLEMRWHFQCQWTREPARRAEMKTILEHQRWPPSSRDLTYLVEILLGETLHRRTATPPYAPKRKVRHFWSVNSCLVLSSPALATPARARAVTRRIVDRASQQGHRRGRRKVDQDVKLPCELGIFWVELSLYSDG